MHKNDFITITNEDIYKELQHVKEVGEKTLTQALVTNGRVTQLEKKSIGVWVSQNPLRFSIYLLVFFSFVISDVRHPIMDLVMKLFL
jgi:hypothetical protein